MSQARVGEAGAFHAFTGFMFFAGHPTDGSAWMNSHHLVRSAPGMRSSIPTYACRATPWGF